MPAAGGRRRTPVSGLHPVPRPRSAALRRVRPGLDACARPRRGLPAVARPRPVRSGHLGVGERHTAAVRGRRRRRLEVEPLLQQASSLLQFYARTYSMASSSAHGAPQNCNLLQLTQWRFLHSKSGGGLFWGQHKCGGAKRLEMYVRSSFSVVNLHDLWINYPPPNSI